VSEKRESGARVIRAPQSADRWLWLVTFALVGCGLLMVFSASQALAYVQHGFTLYYFVRQAVFAGLGLGAMVILARYDYHRLRRYAPLLAGAAALLMVLVLVPGLGISANGARRWFNVGPLSAFQPAELGKLAFAIYLAHWVCKRGDRLQSLADGFAPLAVMLAFVLLVLLLQRDLGTAMITCSIFIAVYFAGGGRKRHLMLLVAVLLLAFLLLITLESYRSQRLGVFLDPFKDPLGVGFQSSQGLLALGSGGLTGVGLGHSIQKYAWLPAAHTDFIFAIVGEETGLVGTTALLGAFTLLGVRGYRVAIRASDRFGMALATGITTWIVFQALLNMGTVTDTLPVTGVPLPFISYGGSALAISMASIGVLLNISRQGEEQPHLRRRLDATLDLGRRHRRSPVPGARRRSSVPR